MPDSATKDSPLEIQYPPSILEDVSKLVQRVQTFTGATGAAIALREGEEMICRGSRGTNAPEVGMELSTDGTFTGLAVTGMKAVRCDDAENDSRVDPEISRALRIKSMAVVPVLSGMRVSGVIAVFSGVNNAFSDTHMAVLKTMADGLGASIQRFLESQGVSTSMPGAQTTDVAPKPQVAPPPPPPPAPRVEAPKPAPVAPPPAPKVEAPKPAPVAPPPAPKVEAPKVEAPRSAPAAAAAAPAPAKKQEPKQQGKWKPVTPPKEEVVEAKPAAKAEPKPEPKPEPKVVEAPKPKTAPAAAASVPSFSYETPAEESGKKNPMVLGGIAAAVLVVAIGGYFMFGRSSKPAATTSPATTTSAPASTTSAPATTSAPVSAAPATTAGAKPEAAKPNDKNNKQQNQPQQQVAESKPAPAPLVVAPGASPAASQPKPADVAPPSISLGAGSGPAIDVPVSTSAPRLSAAAPANAVIVPSRLLSRVNPSYPAAAKQYRIEGAVTLDATISSDGHVSGAKVVSGPPMLRDAAISAVKQWKYAPSTVNGRPVESNVQITLQFKMP